MTGIPLSLVHALPASPPAATAHDASAAAPDTEAAAAEFQAFYLRTSRGLWAYLTAAGGDRALADDLLQESYLRLLQAAGAPREEEARRRYLYRIASNLLADERRTAWRSLPLRTPESGREPQDRGAGRWHAGGGAGGRDGGIAPAELAADPAARGDVHLAVSRALACLPARQRRLLWLAHVEGWDHREIAAILGVGVTSVKVMLFRARKHLADLLGATGAASTTAAKAGAAGKTGAAGTAGAGVTSKGGPQP